jgi:Sua5/YciO/YrdC/YwlC family protein
MQTIIGKEERLNYAAELIRSGEVVAFPTETVYGLGADALNGNAVRKIFEAKGRPADNPLIVHISAPGQVNSVAQNVSELAFKLFQKFSPGPLTLVLKKAPAVPLITTGGLGTVGVRIPRHPLALKLIEACGRPIAAPSANRSGRVSPTEAAHVLEDMDGKIPLILDGGKTEVGIESTVLDLTKEIPVILRPGAITAKMLSEILPKVIDHKGEVIIAEAPGMKYRHYSPTKPCIAALDPESAAGKYDEVLSGGIIPVIIGREDFVLAGKRENHISLGKTVEECMSSLFSALRSAEKKYGYIILQYFSEPEYFSLDNRIKKAAGGEILGRTLQ